MKEDITIKAVYRNSSFLSDTIKSLLTEKCKSYGIAEKMSGGGKFISYTISVSIDDEEVNSLTQSLSAVDGFLMMV